MLKAVSPMSVLMVLVFWAMLLSTSVFAQTPSGLPAPASLPPPSAALQLPPAPQALPSAKSLPPTPAVQDDSYKLGSGDKLRIVVYGESDLGGEYLVDGAGEVQLPLLGQVQAAGLSIRNFAAALGAKFVSEGYLNDPRVSVEVENYRPFYIYGEVKAPGQYPYVSGMNVLNAIALAGGFTYRADERTAYLRRNGDVKEVSAPADQTTKINPGDIIRIDERVF